LSGSDIGFVFGGNTLPFVAAAGGCFVAGIFVGEDD
jgi:hypothetical protein